MTRKRFYKLVLSTRCQRNRAQQITTFARKHGFTIDMEWIAVSVGCICCTMAVYELIDNVKKIFDTFPGGEGDGPDDL